MRSVTKVFVASFALCAMSSGLLAAPLSDGSIFSETFTNYPESPKSAAIGPGANVVGGAVEITTEVPTSGVFRASPLGISGSSEYVLEFDFKINSASGDNFYILYMEGSGAPWNSDIGIRAYTPAPGNGDFAFQVDYGTNEWAVVEGKSFNTVYHMTVHHKVDNIIDLYLDGSLLGSFADRSAGLGTSLVQFGDGSGGAGFGSITVDNISIGAVAIPEPAMLSLAGLSAAGLLRRRR
jgi:hypothetical protein